MNALLGISIVFLLGLLSSKIAEKLHSPAITAYLILGILLGPYVANCVPESVLDASGLISNLALSLIAFSIGQNFSREVFRNVGRQVLWISVLAALGAWLFVFFGLLALGLRPYVCMMFAAIGTATAPAALIMVVRQYKAKGRFTELLMGVVAIDDAWGLISFSVCMAFARKIYYNHASSVLHVVTSALFEIGASFVLGVVIGWATARFSRHVRTEQDLLIYTFGSILLTAGLALHFHLPVLLACMFLSTALVNVNQQSLRFFESIQRVDWPIYMLFFVLAGAHLDISMLSGLGAIGGVYLVSRVAGKCLGTYLGALISRADDDVKKYLGLAQMPQAGVALGMALVAKDYFGRTGTLIFTAIAATTVIYEVIGPFVVKWTLVKAGQITRTE